MTADTQSTSTGSTEDRELMRVDVLAEDGHLHEFRNVVDAHERGDGVQVTYLDDDEEIVENVGEMGGRIVCALIPARYGERRDD